MPKKKTPKLPVQPDQQDQKDLFEDFWKRTPKRVLEELWLPDYNTERFPRPFNRNDLFQVTKREVGEVKPFPLTRKLIDRHVKFELKKGPNSACKLHFRPTEEIKTFLNRCYGASRTAYNKTVEYLAKRNSKDIINTEETTLIRQMFVSNINYEPSITKKKQLLKSDKTKQGRQRYSDFIKTFEGITIPHSYICNEVDIAIATFNRHNKVPKFRSKKTMPRQTICIPHRDMEKQGVSRLLMEAIDQCFTERPNADVDINHDFTISSSKLGKHYVCVPITVPIAVGTESQGPVKVVAIDPGVRTPFTCYDPSGKYFKIADNKLGLLYKLKLKRSTLQSKRDSYKNFNGKYSACETITEKRVHRKYAFKIRRLTKVMAKVQERIENIRKQFHYDTIKYLLDNYDVILLPSFNSKQMIKKARGKIQQKLLEENPKIEKEELKVQKRKLSNEQVAKLLLWAHYSFKTRLLQKAQLRSKRVVIVDEHFTTKTCGKCGALNDVAKKKEFICVGCNTHLDRDINASRNILIRFLSKCSSVAPPATTRGKRNKGNSISAN